MFTTPSKVTFFLKFRWVNIIAEGLKKRSRMKEFA